MRHISAVPIASRARMEAGDWPILFGFWVSLRAVVLLRMPIPDTHSEVTAASASKKWSSACCSQ